MMQYLHAFPILNFQVCLFEDHISLFFDADTIFNLKLVQINI